MRPGAPVLRFFEGFSHGQINLGLHRGNTNWFRVIVIDIEHTNLAKSGKKAVFLNFLRQKLIIFRKEKNGKVVGLVPKGPDSFCGHQRRFVSP
jgi:hypothetical protein